MNLEQERLVGSIVVTGAAGFIGFHVTKSLLDQGHSVIGIDKFSEYYGSQLKRDRAGALASHPTFRMVEGDLHEACTLDDVLDRESVDRVIHLAAQAGVQLSITHPEEYVRSNMVSFANVLQAIKKHGIDRLIFASSSSVYGESPRRPFRESDPVMSPVSMYAATKISNEAMAHAYSHMHNITTIGLRFFTVYGPWGRPDMSYWKFYEAVRSGQPIDLYFEGQAMRDFTYVDDVSRIISTMALSGATEAVPVGSARIYNIGNEHPVSIRHLVEIIETRLGKPADIRLQGERAGDVPWTCADTTRLQADWGIVPTTDLTTGITAFSKWYEAHVGNR